MTADAETLTAQRERKIRLYLEHPGECPEFIGRLPYLIHPPGKLGSTAAWLEFRDETLLPMIEAMPDDPNLRSFLKQAEKILAWRETVPAEDRFWKE